MPSTDSESPDTPLSAEEEPRPTYRFAFSWEGPYGHAVRLVQAHARRGVVLDLGCGYGAVGEVLREDGWEYVGGDRDEEAIADLVSRGFEAHVVDLAASDGLAGRLAALLEGRAVGALLLLDTIEHLPDPPAVLEELAELSEFLGAGGRGAPLLVTSIPNVAHIDLAAKLVGGRWDVTPSGLLDRTHLQMFTERRVDSELSGFGWSECGRDDILLDRSDQAFPLDYPYLVQGGPVYDHLRTLRSGAGPNTTVNQFVRAYRFAPGASRGRQEPTGTPVGQELEQAGPFLSVITRTQGQRPALLAEALTCLAAQTLEDLEVILLVHSEQAQALETTEAVVASFDESFSSRVRIEQIADNSRRAGPLNRGLELARGRYVAFLDDDDLVTADWAEAFFDGVQRSPGKVIRSICYSRHVRQPAAEEAALGGLPVTLTKPSADFSDRFDLIFHLAVNTTPIISFAVPRSLVTELHLFFDEELEVCEDWDFLVRAALLVGLEDTGKVTSIYQRWTDSGTTTTAVADDVWAASHGRMLEKLDSAPLLLPTGMARELATLVKDPGLIGGREEHIAYLERELGQTRATAAEAHERLRSALEERDSLRADLAATKADLASAETVRDELLSSEFWRMTAPLRAVLGRVKRERAAPDGQ